MATPEHIIKRVIGPNHTRATVRPGESMLNVVIGTLRDEDICYANSKKERQ